MRTNLQGSGNHPQSTPFRVREKPRHCASPSRRPTTLPNTDPPVPVTSPRYSLLHARSSTLRRYSASSMNGALSHSGWLSITSRYELWRTSVSARRSRSSSSRFTSSRACEEGCSCRRSRSRRRRAEASSRCSAPRRCRQTGPAPRTRPPQRSRERTSRL